MKWLWLLFLVCHQPSFGVPIIPAFTMGTSQSNTRTTTNVTEHIRSTEYSGYSYSVSGSNIKLQEGDENISPEPTDTEQTINGIIYTWKDLDLSNKPKWILANPNSGDSFLFSEQYRPGGSVKSVTDITRTITSESVIDVTSVFSQ